MSHATSGACIMVHGGVYPESVYISANNITLSGVSGEEPVVSGLKGILGWTTYQTIGSTTVYQTTLSWKPYNFFVGYAPKPIAHSPVDSWYSVPAVSSTATATTITDAAHLAGIPDLTGASVEIWIRSNNTTSPYKIVSHDATAGSITIALTSGIAASDHYVLTNSVSFLQAGQWAVVDPGTGSYTVYYATTSATSLILRSAQSFSVGDIIEINMDGVSRQITAISGNTITFNVPLSHRPFSAQTIVDDWGPNPSSFNRDASLKSGNAGLTLSSIGGAVGSSSSISLYQSGQFGHSSRVLPNVPSDMQVSIPTAYGNAVYLH